MTNTIIVDKVTIEKAGSSSALSEIGYEIGGALGTAILGSMLLVVYQKYVQYQGGLLAQNSEDVKDVAESMTTAHIMADSGNDVALQLLDTADYGFRLGTVAACLISIIVVCALLYTTRKNLSGL